MYTIRVWFEEEECLIINRYMGRRLIYKAKQEIYYTIESREILLGFPNLYSKY